MRRLLLPVLACFCSVAWAADVPRLAPLQGCPVGPVPEMPELPARAPGDDPADPRIDVFSGHAELDLEKGGVFSDQISIRRGEGVLTAPGARYDRAAGEFILEDGIRYRSPQSAVAGSRATFDLKTNSLEVEDADFDIFAVPARGTAGAIAVDRADVLTLEDVTYTTCARGNEDWVLRAGEIEINRDTGMATARHARLEFQGVPILYTPWITYPVTNERQSGFLLPAFGRSQTRGVEFQIPWYWNIAPNYDATLTPRYMAQRGLELMTEFRYLGDGDKGRVEAEYLPNDKIDNDSRYLFGIKHESLLGGGWRATVDATTVSDSNYFEDLYGSMAATSQTNLPRDVKVEYYDSTWSLFGRLQDFQNLDDSLTATEKPYRRLPQVAARGYLPDGALGLAWSFDGELVSFDRNAGVTGTRMHLQPGIALPLDYHGLWIKPEAAVEYTGYSLRNLAPGEADGPTRTTPIYAVDMGAVFERGTREAGSGWLQTLEPRAQFVHIPFRDQDDLPVFDTIEPDFNMVQLFRKNRFLGYDRIGDTNQLSLGLTSRVLDAGTGGEYLTATIGQTRFFSDQKVTLPGETPVDSNASDWLAEIGATLNPYWKANFGYQWDSQDSATQRTQLGVQYRRDGQRVVNMAYRYRRDSLEEVDVSAAWPLTSRWSAVGRYDYSIRDNETLERFVGLEYQTCCWGFRVVYRDYIASRTGESDTAIAVQLILKGLTNVGDPAGRQLERGILGYEAD